MSKMPKRREPLITIGKFERSKVEVGGEEVKEEGGEKGDGADQSQEVGLSVEEGSQGDASWALDDDSTVEEEGAGEMDMSTLQVDFKFDRDERKGEEDEEPVVELTQAEVQRKKRVWNKTSSAPAAFDSFKVKREDSGEDSIESFTFSRDKRASTRTLDTSEGEGQEGEEEIVGVGDVAVFKKPVTPKHVPRAPPGAEAEGEEMVAMAPVPAEMQAQVAVPKTPDIKDKLFLAAEDGSLEEDEKSQVWALDDTESKEDYGDFQVVEVGGRSSMEGLEGKEVEVVVKKENEEVVEEAVEEAVEEKEEKKEEREGEKEDEKEKEKEKEEKGIGDSGKISPSSELTSGKISPSSELSLASDDGKGREEEGESTKNMIKVDEELLLGGGGAKAKKKKDRKTTKSPKVTKRTSLTSGGTSGGECN
jgi:hypothetical protein